MVRSTVHALPRIGPDRELKSATEGYWAGRIPASELHATATAIRTAQLRHLAAAGVDLAPSNTFSFYDQVLDTAVMLGALPERFATYEPEAAEGRDAELDRYFAAARGVPGRPAMEMTKWFDSNYHYLVPELGPSTRFTPDAAKPLAELAEAVEIGVPVAPVLVGPVTFLLLARSAEGAPADFSPLQLLDAAVDAYVEVLARLRGAGAQWVHLDEPALVTDRGTAVLDAARRAYERLAAATDRPQLSVRGYFGDLGPALPMLAALPLEGIGIDLVRGPSDLAVLRDLGPQCLAGKTVFAGVIDGRNVWRSDLDASLALVRETADAVSDPERIVVSTSCSLQHVPWDAARETSIDDELRSWLAFAVQKVEEVVTLARGLDGGSDSIAAELAENRAVMASRRGSTRTRDPLVRARTADVDEKDGRRGSEYAQRRRAQDARLGLPAYPTTTIGSFPQTKELRAARAANRRGALDDAAYAEAMRAEIRRVVELQEELGIDMLVHGEPERNDMVAYFADQLTGIAATEHGWVQSFGTRYVRPPIIFGDVSRPAPMTVEWAKYAQSLTDKPMKGMLTGPVTLLLWSFVRDDQPLSDTCLQLALAVRDEVSDLQDAGIAAIQVDEPALREGLPLRRARRAEYLEWATRCFRIATAVARDDVQVHTHMCYADFDDILDAVDALDADVISMEAARSAMHLPRQLQLYGYPRQVGPGVYDIHSPTVPEVEEMLGLLRAAADNLPTEALWVNPDCGLKTRGYDEVVPALRNLVEAAVALRSERVSATGTKGASPS